MKVWGVDYEHLEQIADELGIKLYEVRQDGRALRLTLRPNSEKDENGNRRWQRTSASPFNMDRRVFAICWHGHYHFMHRVFEVNPDARIKTMWADYKSADEFDDNAIETGYRNIGAPIMPIQAREACNCWMTGDDYIA